MSEFPWGTCLCSYKYRIVFIPGYSQELIINETHVTAIHNEEAKFEFLVKKGVYEDTVVRFYIGEHPNQVKLLLRVKEPTSLATMLFGDRLAAATLKGEFNDPEYTYVITITELQYNYTGSYYFEITFLNRHYPNMYLNRTIKLNVTGRKCILCD